MPMQRWIASAAGGTSHRLKPGPATIRSLSRKPVATLYSRDFVFPNDGARPLPRAVRAARLSNSLDACVQFIQETGQFERRIIARENPGNQAKEAFKS
jgi:hypothetical protein